MNAQGIARSRRQLELTETNSAEILTNLNQLSTKKPTERSLEEQLQLLKGLHSERSLEQRLSVPDYHPPVRPALSRKAAQELLDRKENWGLSAEEMGLVNGTTEQDILSKFSETKGKGGDASLEQFYQGLNRWGKTSSSSSSDSTSASKFEGFAKDDPSLPQGVREKAQALQEISADDPNSMFGPASKPRSSFENFFGLQNKAGAVSGETSLRSSTDTFLDEFKKVLEGESANRQIDPTLNALLPGVNSTPKLATTPVVDTIPNSNARQAPRRDVVQTPDPNQVRRVANQIAIADPTTTVLNQWNPLYSASRREIPKPTVQSPLSLDFPRRKF